VARLTLLASLAAMLVTVAPPAHACSCASDGASSPEAMPQIIELHDGGIFVGTVTGTERFDRLHVVTMRVDRVIKGAFGPVVNVDTTDPFREICGGWSPAVGSRTGLFVEGSATAGWWADVCSLRVDPADLLAFAARPPDPSIQPIGPTAVGSGSFPLWISVAAVTVLVATGVRLLLTRRAGDARAGEACFATGRLSVSAR